MQSKEVCALPAKPLHVVFYLNFLIQKATSRAPVQEASAITWVHQMATIEDPTHHPIVRNVLEGAKRMLAQHVPRKEPITLEILARLVEKFATPDANLSAVRTLTICLVAYAGFFRFDEISKNKETDVSILRDHIEIFIESSKTDQYRDGARVVIARGTTNLCPVSMMEKYLDLSKIEDRQEKFLFRGLVNTKNGARLRDSGSLSYTRVRELVLEMLSAIGLDKKKFGLHSL